MYWSVIILILVSGAVIVVFGSSDSWPAYAGPLLLAVLAFALAWGVAGLVLRKLRNYRSPRRTRDPAESSRSNRDPSDAAT